jgi:DnaK suppressor protein
MYASCKEKFFSLLTNPEQRLLFPASGDDFTRCHSYDYHRQWRVTMDGDTRKMFLTRLSTRKAELEHTLDSLQQNQRDYNDRFSGDNNMDESDQAQREISVVNNYRLIERKMNELQKINLLIRRISENKNFGECEDCGETIPLERLLLVPGSSLCVECQRESEKVEHIRYIANTSSASYRGKRYLEPDAGELEDDLDFPLIDPDLEIISPPEFDEPDSPSAG